MWTRTHPVIEDYANFGCLPLPAYLERQGKFDSSCLLIKAEFNIV